MSLLRWALIFLLISLVAALFGFTGLSAATADIARILFYIFLVIFVVLLILGTWGLARPLSRGWYPGVFHLPRRAGEIKRASRGVSFRSGRALRLPRFGGFERPRLCLRKALHRVISTIERFPCRGAMATARAEGEQ